jgi:hypothetical protein
MNEKLEKLIEKAKTKVDAMPPAEREAMHKAQKESWVRAEMSWPKPQCKWLNGTKIYDSYEDFCND